MSTFTARRSAALLITLMALTGCESAVSTDPAVTAGDNTAFASLRKPVHERTTETYANEFDCGGFTGLSSGEVTLQTTTFFDGAGTPIRFRFHFHYDATITNLTTGKTLPDDAAYSGEMDFVTGQLVANGKVYNVKDRESGFRIKDIGRIVFDGDGNVVFRAGRHDVDAFGDATPGYCEALS